MNPPPTECYDDAWWDSHERGTHDRPRPGTRVLITEPGRYHGLHGIVTFYEGQWNSSTFPVQITSTGITMLFTRTDTEVLIPARAKSYRVTDTQISQLTNRPADSDTMTLKNPLIT